MWKRSEPRTKLCDSLLTPHFNVISHSPALFEHFNPVVAPSTVVGRVSSPILLTCLSEYPGYSVKYFVTVKL